MDETFIKEVRLGHRHLAKVDPVMEKIINRVGEVVIELEVDPFSSLVSSIVSQVISFKAAETVWRRIQERADFRVKPEVLVGFSQEEFRELGIGKQKYVYISSLAESFLANPDRFRSLQNLDDQEVIKTLTGLKGIGKWTAQMFLIFSLGRLDVFAPDDLALKNVMLDQYLWNDPPKRAGLVRKAELWAPYRSIACLLLWRSLK